MARNKYPEETVQLILDVSTKLFLTKGFDNTSIQDIINELGGLSKGAIYHHFKSKDDILLAVAASIGNQTAIALGKIRDDNSLSPLEKLKELFRASLSETEQMTLFASAPNIMKNPQFLAIQIQEIFEEVAPKYILPILEEGEKDGTIKTDYPEELAEIMMILSNLWLNPMILNLNSDAMVRKCKFFGELLKSFNINIIDDEFIKIYENYIKIYLKKKESY